MTGRRSAPDPQRLGQELGRIVATTDVHSALDRADSLAAHLYRLRQEGALIVDCGDFLEGSGYYLLGKGRTETALLRGLYDVAAPGNHGYHHHTDDSGVAAITVCANITGTDGATVWPSLRLARVGGRSVAVTAVLSVEAFTSIPPYLRNGHRVTDPAETLRILHSRYGGQVESWIVLSHSGFAYDRALAAACPFLDVVFSGHCHSPENGPAVVGDTVVVKGRELGVGYAVAKPGHGRRWQASTYRFPPGAALLPAHVLDPLAQIAELRRALDTPIGRVREKFAARTPARHELLSHLARVALTTTEARAAMLNVTCLREVSLGAVLTVSDLLSTEPFANTVTCVTTYDPRALAAHLRERSGELVCQPQPLPSQRMPVKVAVTSYLAATHLAGCDLITDAEDPSLSEAEPSLGMLLREVLLAPRQ